MKEIIDIFRKSSPFLIFIIVITYFVKFSIEKKIEGVLGRIEEINKTSLEVKKELREEERSQLVAFRVAVEKWEYFLQTAVFDFTIKAPSDSKIEPLYKKDRELFLEVKIAIVKACIYLRNKDLEQQLMNMVLNIRKNYYPIINETLPRLIDVQSKLMLFENKLEQFHKSGMKDMSFAPTEEDREENLKLQTVMTKEIEKYKENSIKQNKSIAEKMYDLKEAINQYIYRPIKQTEINKD